MDGRFVRHAGVKQLHEIIHQQETSSRTCHDKIDGDHDRLARNCIEQDHEIAWTLLDFFFRLFEHWMLERSSTVVLRL